MYLAHLIVKCIVNHVGKGVQSEKLAGFQCAEPEIVHSYKYRHLRTALANLPVAKDGSCSISSKVLALLSDAL